MTRLNRIGAELGKDPDVHAVTDVTGFGILGHGLEVARGSGLALEIDGSALPLLADAEALARDPGETVDSTLFAIDRRGVGLAVLPGAIVGGQLPGNRGIFARSRYR